MIQGTQTTPFVANPRWKRTLWRLWRTQILVRFVDRRWIYILPPREWSQETADAAISRGQELAKEHGW